MRSWPRSRGCSTIPTPDVAWGRPDAGASKRSFRGRAWPSGPSASTATPSTISRRPRASRGVVLAGLRGFVFDLDGCVWQGERLNPGAADTLAALHHAGRGVAYLTNNSRARGADVAAKLRRLGVTPTEPALPPLELLGDVARGRWGRSRVLVIGAAELGAVVEAAGHTVVDVRAWRDATVVAVGNDFDLTYERLTAAARAAAAGAPVVTPNIDP